MTQDPLFFVGIAFLGAAIVGGGLKLAGTEIPVLTTEARQIAAAVLGVVLIYLAYQSHHFRVTKVTLEPVGVYRGPCPGQKTFQGTISTAGGAGTVDFRIKTSSYISPPGALTFKDGETLGYQVLVPVYRTGSEKAWTEIVVPSTKDSSPATYSVLCSSPIQASPPPPQVAPTQRPIP